MTRRSTVAAIGVLSLLAAHAPAADALTQAQVRPVALDYVRSNGGWDATVDRCQLGHRRANCYITSTDSFLGVTGRWTTWVVVSGRPLAGCSLVWEHKCGPFELA